MSSQESNVDRLLKARAEIDEELRRHKTALTILFTDVVGSTAYFDRYGDTAGLAMLHRQAELTAATVSEFRGTVVKTIGDSVMAEFPEPAFAVRAGVELQRRLLLLNQKLPERERVQLRVGINHGPAFRHGSDVYGDAVNLAARITKRSGPAQVLIARSVRDAILLDPELRCTWLGKLTLEGKAEKEDLFEVVWTDTATYADLRAHATAAFARGELVSPGVRLDHFIQPGPPPTPIPPEETAAELPPTPAPASVTARYDILGEVGSGGMGIVYKARDRETGAVVALKVLQPEIAARPDIIERFKAELLLARKITHKNVCRTYELLRFGDTVVIAMEYVEGESLRAILNSPGGVSSRRGLEWVKQICSALVEAHAQGVVHRDLKPENILITRDATVKVMDFGIARSLETAATQTGAIIGTPAYMSPEQAEGKTADARSDIYSLGLVLYEMFTGAPTFRAETPVALAHKQIHETPPPPSAVEPHLPSFLDRAIQKCLEKNPKKRFQSVAELEAALAEKPAPELTPEGEPVPAPHLSVWRRPDWVLLTLGVVGLVYFLGFRDSVFPASRMRLEVDAISARRAAEDLGTRLGRPFPENSQVEREFRSDLYSNVLRSWMFVGQGLPFSSVWPAELPILWRVKFRSATDPILVQVGGAPDRFALVDRKGRVKRFSHPMPAGLVPPGLRAPPVEERRAQAQQAAELTCGPLPAGVKLNEISGGERGASYTAVWRTGGGSRWAQVTLLAAKVVDVECSLEWGLHLEGQHFTKQLDAAVAPIQRWHGLAVGLVVSVVLVLLFIFGHCYRLPGLWKRVPLAVVLGVSAGWLLSTTLELLGTPEASGFSASVLFMLGGVAAAGLALLGLVTAEHFLRRRAPEWIASYLLAWRGRLLDPAVSLAVVRGALAGLALVALETLVTHIQIVLLQTGQVSRWPLPPFFFFTDPGIVAQAGESFSPWLYVLAAAVFDGVFAGVILLGLPWAFSSRRYRRRKRFGAISAAASVLWLIAVLWVRVGQFTGAWRQPPTAGLVLFPLEALLLAWLLARYDVLTVIVAIATAVVWILNYPLLTIFAEVGNAGHWAVFAGWGALVAVCAALAFRAPLRGARQRLAAAFE